MCSAVPEPRMLVGRVIWGEIEHQPNAGGVQRVDELVQVLQRAEPRVHVEVVRDVVPEIYARRPKDRRKPYRVHAEPSQVIDALAEAAEVTQPVAIRIGEAVRVDLVEDRSLPPRGWMGTQGAVPSRGESDPPVVTSSPSAGAGGRP
jgi:hypothetical protein